MDTTVTILASIDIMVDVGEYETPGWEIEMNTTRGVQSFHVIPPEGDGQEHWMWPVTLEDDSISIYDLLSDDQMEDVYRNVIHSKSEPEGYYSFWCRICKDHHNGCYPNACSEITSAEPITIETLWGDIVAAYFVKLRSGVELEVTSPREETGRDHWITLASRHDDRPMGFPQNPLSFKPGLEQNLEGLFS